MTWDEWEVADSGRREPNDAELSAARLGWTPSYDELVWARSLVDGTGAFAWEVRRVRSVSSEASPWVSLQRVYPKGSGVPKGWERFDAVPFADSWSERAVRDQAGVAVAPVLAPL